MQGSSSAPTICTSSFPSSTSPRGVSWLRSWRPPRVPLHKRWGSASERDALGGVKQHLLVLAREVHPPHQTWRRGHGGAYVAGNVQTRAARGAHDRSHL